MFDLKAFMRSHVASLAKVADERPEDSRNALQIREVASTSIAGSIGLQTGDWLYSVDDVPASRVNFEGLANSEETYTYRFYVNSRNILVVLRCSGIPLGATYSKSSLAIVKGSLSLRFDPIELFSLWERSDWPALKKAARRVTWRYRMIRMIARIPAASPASLMLGAALWEQGATAKAMKLVHAYRSVEHCWTTQFHAVQRFYCALDELECGRRRQAAALLAEAFAFNPQSRFADEYRDLTGRDLSPPPQPIGDLFPVAYELRSLKRRNSVVALRDVLARMKPHQVFIVCLLASYRGNGPYNEFMLQYRRLAEFMRPVIAGLHVITEERVRRKDRSFWYDAEDELWAAEVPFDVLYDPDGDLTNALMPTKSPSFVVLSQSGHMLSLGPLTEVDLWNAIDSAQQL